MAEQGTLHDAFLDELRDAYDGLRSEVLMADRHVSLEIVCADHLIPVTSGSGGAGGCVSESTRGRGGLVAAHIIGSAIACQR